MLTLLAFPVIQALLIGLGPHEGLMVIDHVEKGGKARYSSLLVADSSGICAALPGTLVLK